jgi:hypothetical protein
MELVFQALLLKTNGMACSVGGDKLISIDAGIWNQINVNNGR